MPVTDLKDMSKRATQNVSLISFTDLISMRDYLLDEMQKIDSPRIKKLFEDKLKEVQTEIWDRVFGFNPMEC